MKTLVLLIGAGAWLSGCTYLTPPFEHPIIEQHAQNRINTFGVVPSRRMMIVKSDDAGGGAERKVTICAEAPADVTDNLASSFAASVAASGKGVDASAGFEKTLQTFGQFLFKRTQGIQLFRDRSYYLCQARMNGFITDAEYKQGLDDAFRAVVPLIEKELEHLDKTQPENETVAQQALKAREIKASAGGAKTSLGADTIESSVESAGQGAQ